MNTLSEEGVLKAWITHILPDEDKGDIESGYCFYKKVGEHEDDFESILRIIDTRIMKDIYQQIFWNKLEEIRLELNKESGIGYLINELYESYQSSLKDTYVPPENETLKDIFLLNGFEISK